MILEELIFIYHTVYQQNFGINGILPHAINLYNSLPLSVTNGSINKFKLRASDYYFSKCIEN